MGIDERWIQENPPCEDPDCHDCKFLLRKMDGTRLMMVGKNDAMSFDYLKTAFLDSYGSDERPSRRAPHAPHPPSRSYSQSAFDSGSDTESLSGHPARSLIPHSRLPPSAPTPPNEPTSDREPEYVETKTSISINADGLNNGSQIVLSIASDNKKKPLGHSSSTRRHKPPPPQDHDSMSSSSRPSSPHHHSHLPPPRQIEPPPCMSRPPQVIDALPPPPPSEDLTLYSPPQPESRPPSPPPLPSTPPPPPLRPRLLEGKVVAITGASRGIGRALALGFAREGAHIIAHYWGTRTDPANEEIVSLCVSIRSLGQGCTIVFGDISDPSTSSTIIRRAIETHGRLDIAVSNAGMCLYRDFLDVTPELLKRHVDVNLAGAFWFTQAAARQFKKQFLAHPVEEARPDWSILCVTGESAGGRGGEEVHWRMAAAGLREMVKSVSRGCAEWGVRVNCVSPGVVQTKMVKEVVEDGERRKVLEGRSGFGRVGTPGDVVGPAIWLVGEGGRWVTGQEVRVDGGAGEGW